MFFEIIEEVVLRDVLKFAFNKNSTYVLIKFMELPLAQSYLDNIFAVLVKNFVDLSQDPNGLPVVKTCIAKFK